ncbi:hypothetical protein AAC387_Pa05g3890 [Persea americana]
MLQSEQMADLFRDSTVEGVVGEVDASEEGEIFYVGRYGSRQAVASEFQRLDPLNMIVLWTADDSFPLAKMERVVPRANDLERIARYFILQVKESEPIRLVSQGRRHACAHA